MHNTTRFASGSGWAFLGRIGALSLGLISSVLLARVLAPADFGTYFLILTIARVAVLVGQIGMNQVVVRFIAGSMASGSPGMARDTVIKSFAIALAGSCFVGFAYILSSRILAISFFGAPIMATVSGLVFFWIIAGTLRILAAECFRGFNDLKMASMFELFAFELLFSILILVVWISYGEIVFYSAVFFSTVAAIISAFPAILLLRKKIIALPAENIVSFHELLQTGWPLLISNIVVVIMTQVGLWIVGIIATPTDVALYASAFRLVLLMQLPLLILNSVVPQLIAELHVQGNTMEIERTLRMVAMAEFVPTVVIYGIFLFFGQSFLTLFFGNFYADSYWILILLGAGIMVNSWAGFCGPALMMTGNQHSLMKISLICGMLALLFAFPIGKQFGAAGVAAVMAFINGVQHICMLMAVKRHIGVWTMVGNLSGLARRVRHFGR